MKSKKFDKSIKPLMNLVEDLCESEGIKFLAQFDLTDQNSTVTKTVYHYQSKDMILDAGTIMNQYQKLIMSK